MISRFIIAMVIFSLPYPAFCSDPFLSKWKATCDCEGVVFNLLFSSQSGDPTDDDMIVKFLSAGGIEFNIPIKQALYSQRSVVSDIKNICDKIGGFDLKNKQILLWLSRNDRPHWDQLTLILIDLNKYRVLDVKEDIGPIKDVDGNQKMTIRKKDDGYEIRLEREWLKNTGTDSAENSIEDWMYIQIVNNKIMSRWSR